MDGSSGEWDRVVNGVDILFDFEKLDVSGDFHLMDFIFLFRFPQHLQIPRNKHHFNTSSLFYHHSNIQRYTILPKFRYCRFYRGRRSTDDPRQISRWLKSAGPKGRFRSQLCNKIIAANTHAGNAKISPVIRQTLLHWGLEVTESILERHRRRK